VTPTASGTIGTDPNSTVTQVTLYVDSNGDGKPEPGTDALPGSGHRHADGTWSLTVSTAGTYTLFAQATDSYGVLGDPIALTLQLT
jgi:hypothetical protein